MILDQILAHKRVEVEAAKAAGADRKVRALAESSAAAGGQTGFRAALMRRPEVALIAEVKKASPSKGLIRPDFDPVRLATWYETGGAAAVSVLTDERFFQGSLLHLDQVRAAVSMPILRKEFIIDPFQVYEAKAHGADAVLLIVAALDRSLLADLFELIRTLGMDALVEVHTEDELAVAVDLGADLIGINNRDLKTFHTTLDVSRRLVPQIPESAVVVSESGISSRRDVDLVAQMGVHAVLVGEALARERDVLAKVEELTGKATVR